LKIIKGCSFILNTSPEVCYSSTAVFSRGTKRAFYRTKAFDYPSNHSALPVNPTQAMFRLHEPRDRLVQGETGFTLFPPH